MRIASLRDLFNYGAWANTCVWDTAADLNDEQLDRAFEMGEGSLRKTLAHVYGAERAWYDRCGGPNADKLPRSSEMHKLNDIQEATRRISQMRGDWLMRMNDAALDCEVTYTRNGHGHTHPLSDILLHVCNHGIHHRAQALNMLRRLGKKVQMLDVMAMRIQQEDQPALSTDLQTLRSYYEYTDWANGLVFDIAETLDDGQLRREFEMGMGCILKTLAHMRDAEQWWFENWHNGGAHAFEQIQKDTTVRQLRDAYQETIDNRHSYFAGLNDDDLDRTVTASPTKDKTYGFTLGESMLQLCSHGTHHRAQIINMFRHVGTEVPKLDFIAMKRLGSAVQENQVPSRRRRSALRGAKQ